MVRFIPLPTYCSYLRHFILVITSFFSTHTALAQSIPVQHKLGASLKLLLAAENKINTERKYETIAVLIELTDKSILPALVKNRVSIYTIAGTILTAEISTADIPAVAALEGVKRIELPQTLQIQDDKMKNLIGAKQVHHGLLPLSTGYKGKGVVIGVIDDGIDITHPDFYTKDGQSRIQYLWNMDYFPNGLPTPDNYGYEWKSDSIKYYAEAFRQQRFSRQEMQKRFGYANHGTPVTGVAAGNNGVAPEADIIAVSLTATIDKVLNTKFLIDGIAYIYKKAQAQDKKCIINISLGVNEGAPHHGKSLVEKAIDNFCAEHPDLLVCVSAGNNGNNWKHWGGYPIHADSSFSFFYNSSKASLYFAIPRKFRDSLSISVAESPLGSLNAPNYQKDSVFYQTPYVKITDLLSAAFPVSFESKNKKGEIKSYLDLAASVYDEEYDEVVLSVNSLSNGTAFDPHLYRFIFKGKGIVHAWFPFLNLHPVFLFDRNPLPNDPTFSLSDNHFTTTIPSNAHRVLTVGAFNLRSCYSNIHNKVVHQYESCRMTYFSSHGPTLDNRIKPDIIAPGDNVLAPRSRMDDFLGHQMIIDTNTVSFGGTSCSSPITAGAAALLWGLNPELTAEQVKQRLKETARQDAWTAPYGSQPNNITGWGKVDVFKAITGVTLADTTCGKTDVCKVPVIEPPPVLPPSGYYKIYPNPVQGKLSFSYASYFTINLSLYDAEGRLVWKKSLPPSYPAIQSHFFSTIGLSTGIYFLHIQSKEVQETKKMMIQTH